jgi:hypothetical protein
MKDIKAKEKVTFPDEGNLARMFQRYDRYDLKDILSVIQEPEELEIL